MGDNVINLTSSDEEREEIKEPPRKRIKPTLIQAKPAGEPVLLISSDEEDELPHLPEITIIKPKQKSLPSTKNSSDETTVKQDNSVKNSVNGNGNLNIDKENICDDIEIVSTTSEEETESEDDTDEEDTNEIDVKIEELYNGYDDSCEIIDETDEENVNNSMLGTVEQSNKMEVCVLETQENNQVTNVISQEVREVELDTVLSRLQTGKDIDVFVLETEQTKEEVTKDVVVKTCKVENKGTESSEIKNDDSEKNRDMALLSSKVVKNEKTDACVLNGMLEVKSIDNDISMLELLDVKKEEIITPILKKQEMKIDDNDVIILDTEDVSAETSPSLEKRRKSKESNSMLINTSKNIDCKNSEKHRSESNGQNKVYTLQEAKMGEDSGNVSFECMRNRSCNSGTQTLSEHYANEQMASIDSDDSISKKRRDSNVCNAEATSKAENTECSVLERKKRLRLNKMEEQEIIKDTEDSIPESRRENTVSDSEAKQFMEDNENHKKEEHDVTNWKPKHMNKDPIDDLISEKKKKHQLCNIGDTEDAMMQEKSKFEAFHLKTKETSDDTDDSLPKKRHLASHSESHERSEDSDGFVPEWNKQNRASTSKACESLDDTEDSMTEKRNHYDKKVEKKKLKEKEPENITPFSYDTCKAKEYLEKFFDACSESIKDTKYEPLKSKYRNLQNLLLKYIKSNGMNDEIKKMIKDNTAKARRSPSDAVFGFNALYEYMKDSVDNPIEVQPELREKVRKLLKTMLKLLKKIKKLEESEVDFDADADSAYLQEDRYKRRLAQVYEYYCKLLKMNPRSGRITFKKLDFSSSNYNEINQAINKKIKNNTKFPTYGEIEKIVKKCVKEHKLHFTEQKIKLESEKCFKAIGELLQTRRKHELYESHYNFIREETDPAAYDPSLDKRLKKSFIEGLKKIDDVCQRYTEKQYSHKDDTPLSEDSDDSHYKDSDSDSEPEDK